MCDYARSQCSPLSLSLSFLSLCLALSSLSSIPPNFASGEILNNQKAMEYNTQTGNLTCAFNFMQLRRIKRNSDKKASEVSPTSTTLTVLWSYMYMYVGQQASEEFRYYHSRSVHV